MDFHAGRVSKSFCVSQEPKHNLHFQWGGIRLREATCYFVAGLVYGAQDQRLATSNARGPDPRRAPIKKPRRLQTEPPRYCTSTCRA